MSLFIVAACPQAGTEYQLSNNLSCYCPCAPNLLPGRAFLCQDLQACLAFCMQAMHSSHSMYR